MLFTDRKHEHHHHLLSWLTHIKHHHDKENSPVNHQKEIDALSIQHTNKDNSNRSSFTDDEFTSIHEDSSSQHSSVFTLPEDIDSPTVGFKKLKKDGFLIDWSESDIDQQEEDNDSLEFNRIYLRSVIRHDLIQLALNGPFQSPLQLNSKKHVLHIGCGDGSWCIETALMYPHWLVIGMDDKTGGLSPDQRKVPKNFKYIRNCYSVLRTIRDLPSNSFDFIHSRFLLDVYGDEQYMELIQECKRICKPNGFIELYELDMRIYGNPKAGPITHKLNAAVFQSMEDRHLNPRLARKLGDMVSSVFSPLDSYAKYTSLPLGIWGGRLGVMFRDSIAELFFEYNHHLSDSLSSISNSSSLSGDIPYDNDIEAMIKEMELQKAFMNLHHVYARK